MHPTSTLRMATVDDAAAVAEIYAPYVLQSGVSFETEPPGPDELRRRMAAVLPQYPWLLAEIDGVAAGYAYAGVHHERAAYRWSVTVSAYLHRDVHRRGIGRQLYAALFALLREQGYVQVYAGITLPNPASVGLHEALGFRAVGVYRQVGFKQGRWLDVGWWGLGLVAPPAAPAEPVSWTALPAHAVHRALEPG